MRVYSVNGEPLIAGRAFEHGGLAHPANWASVYSEGDLKRFGIAFEDQPDPEPEAPRRMIAKALILERLTDEQLSSALSLMTVRQKERWRMPGKPLIYADDAELLALLTAIGADHAVVLADE